MLSQEDRAKQEVRRILRETEAGGPVAIEQGLTFGIAKLRREARDRGKLALAGELDQARKDGLEVWPGRGTIGTSMADVIRSNRIARNTATAWEQKDAQGLDATLALDSRLDTIAITETAEAFNDERRLVLRETKQQRTSGSLVLFEFWDAALDRRICPICERASGTFVLLGQGFPSGRPGGVHARCRCNGTVIALPFWYTSEVETDGEFEYEAA